MINQPRRWLRCCLPRWLALAGLLILGILPACAPPSQATAPPAAPTSTLRGITQPSPVTAFAASPPPGAVPIISPFPTWPAVPTATLTSTPTPIPTYTVLRGQVLVRSNCRYGSGAPYLYKYGLVPGSNLEVIGRTDLGAWILVRAIGGDNPCWVKASLMQIKGDVMSVAPTYIPLPQSPYYAPPEWVQAKRAGSEVEIYWQPVYYRAGDETAQAPYLIEAWVCRDAKLVFIPVGVYETQVKILDEPGCSEASHARLYFVEKHGYSRWIKVPWP